MFIFFFKQTNQTSKQKKGDSHNTVRSEVGKTKHGVENNSYADGQPEPRMRNNILDNPETSKTHLVHPLPGNEINVRTFVTQTHTANTSESTVQHVDNLENEGEQRINSETYMEIIRDPNGVKFLFLK